MLVEMVNMTEISGTVMQSISESNKANKMYVCILDRVVNEYPVNRVTVERTEYRLVKLVLGYSVKRKYIKQNVANIKIHSV